MIKRSLGVAGLVAATALAAGSPAQAEEFNWSMTLAGTSDYVFRGISQSKEDPAFQMSLDATYGIFYAGVWGSNIDLDGPGVNVFGSTEIDFYAGIKPVVGPVTFDLGVLYYYYPGSNDPDGADANAGSDESDYVELKAGASMTPFENAAAGVTYYYTPDNFGEADSAHTVEGSLGYTLPAIGMFTPTVSGVLGYVKGEGDLGSNFIGFSAASFDDDYVYWNAGVALAVEKWTFDFRYHDTDINESAVCNLAALQCDERFVFTAKITLP